MANQSFKVSQTEISQRLDLLLTKRYGGSRSHWQQVIKLGEVSINGAVARASHITELGELISFKPSGAETAQPISAPDLDIIYQDPDMLVVNKPAGLLMHPVSGKFNEPTVALFAAGHTTDPDPERPGIVHRLDRDTSGLVVIAKNESSKKFLQDQFRRRDVSKTYLMLVEGHLRETEALIDLPIGRKADTASRSVLPTGRPAQTYYKVIEEFPAASLVEAQPKTGRTHQLRVHFSHLGHPILGDKLYGHRPPDGLKRMFLHALRLELLDSHQKFLKFEAPLPPELVQYLSNLRKTV